MSYELIRGFLKKNYVASTFIIYLIGTVLLNGISFLTIPIFTRVLSTSDFGITTIFQTWVAFFAVFIGCQVSGSIATARVHKGAEQIDGYMKSIVVLSLVGAVVISSMCLLFIYNLTLFLQIDGKLIPHLLIQAYGAACATLYSTYTIQTKKPKKNVIFSVVLAICTVTLNLVLILSFQEDKYLGKIYSGTIVYIVVILYVLKRFINGQKTKVNLLDWKYSIGLSTPLIIHLLSNIVIGQSDRLFLKNLIGYEAAAIYSVSYNLGTLGMIFADVCNNVWSPWYLDNTKASNHARVNDAAKKYVMAVCGVFVIVMLVAPEVIKIMAPEEYWSGMSSLVIITASVFFQYLYRFPLAYEQFSRNLKWVAVCTICSALINMALNYLFIEFMGMVGAAVATFISYIILFGMHEFVARKIIKGFNIRFVTYLPGILGCLVFAVVSYFVVDFWYVRYGILLIIGCVGLILLIRYKQNSADSV